MANFPPDILKDWILTTRHELKQCNNKGCYKPNIFHKNLTIFSTEKNTCHPKLPLWFLSPMMTSRREGAQCRFWATRHGGANMAGWNITSIFGQLFSVYILWGFRNPARKQHEVHKNLENQDGGLENFHFFIRRFIFIQTLVFSSYPCNFSGVYYGKV